MMSLGSGRHQVSHLTFQVTAANFTRVITHGPAPVTAPGGALSSIAAAAGLLSPPIDQLIPLIYSLPMRIVHSGNHQINFANSIVGTTAGGVSVYRDGGGGVAITAVATQPPPAAHSNALPPSQQQPGNAPPPAGLVTQVVLF